MVDLKRKRYGLDTAGDKIRLVSRSMVSGMVKIDSLEEIEGDYEPSGTFDIESDLYFSVPESEAIIKRVTLSDDRNLDPRQMAQFEFSTSLLDPPEAYYMEVYDLNGNNEKLAVGYNRICVDNRIDRLTDRFTKPAGFKLRSLALADGYRYYCRSEGGELICLLDISENIGSYCFLWDNSPTLPGALYSSTGSTDRRSNHNGHFAVDLAATLQFQLAGLFRTGRSVPLSRILVSGSSVDDSLIEQIEVRMKVGVGFPSMKSASFSPETLDNAHRFLVGLGLTVDI